MDDCDELIPLWFGRDVVDSEASTSEHLSGFIATHMALRVYKLQLCEVLGNACDDRREGISCTMSSLSRLVPRWSSSVPIES